MNGLHFITLGRRVANLYATMSAPICHHYGINQTCLDILLFCANNPAHNTARDLCALRGIKSGLASVGVETLIREGLLTRQDDPADRRIRRLTPTEKAAPIIAEGRQMQARFGAVLTEGISAEEWEVFAHMTEIIEENLVRAGHGEGGEKA